MVMTRDCIHIYANVTTSATSLYDLIVRVTEETVTTKVVYVLKIHVTYDPFMDSQSYASAMIWSKSHSRWNEVVRFHGSQIAPTIRQSKSNGIQNAMSVVAEEIIKTALEVMQ